MPLRAIVAMFALSLAAPGCAEEFELQCPKGWSSVDDACEPAPETLDALPFDSGIVGVIFTTSCACGPGDSGEMSQEFHAGHIQFFDISGGEHCPDPQESVVEVEPPPAELLVDDTVAFDDGVFEIELPPGDYCLQAKTKWTSFGGQARVVEGEITAVNIRHDTIAQ